MASMQTQVAHIWRRLGFGPAPGDVSAGAATGPQALVDSLLSLPATQSSAATPNPWGFPTATDYTAEGIYTGRMLELMAFGPNTSGSGATAASYNPLQERLSWILHGLVVVAIIDAVYYADLKDHVNLLRNSAFGSYKQLLLEVSTRPGMLKYLNGHQNVAGHPNQNYARELMELFSLGRVHPLTGATNYSQGDIEELARALTGWQYNWNNGTTFFSQSQWDPGVKMFRGQSLGAAKLPEVIEALAAHPSFRYYVPRRFFQELVGLPPSAATLEALATAFGPTGDLKALVAAIVAAPEFLSDAAIFAKVKQPVELVASAARLLGFKRLADGSFYLGTDLRTLSQYPLSAPNVSGWPRGDSWLGATSLVNWSSLAGRMALNGFSWDGTAGSGVCPTVTRLFSEGPASTAPDRLLGFAGLDNASMQTRAQLADYAASGPWSAARAAGLIHLLLLAPEFLAC